jgi:hypothetical protein
MKLTAQEIYDKLVNETKLIGEKGTIYFKLRGLDIKIESRDTVGNLLQEWLENWLVANDVEFGFATNSQDFPDFHLDLTNLEKGLLEVKCFDYDKSANFDVAAFMAYRRSLLSHPYRLDSDYLIIGYSMVKHEIEIKNIWLKKVWEITGPSADWPLKCQVKQGELFNIRPIKWYNNERTEFKPFNSALSFVEAFDANQRQWTATARDKETSTWLGRVKKGYKDATGKDLT